MPLSILFAGLNGDSDSALPAKAHSQAGDDFTRPVGADQADQLQVLQVPSTCSRSMHRPSSQDTMTCLAMSLLFKHTGGHWTLGLYVLAFSPIVWGDPLRYLLTAHFVG
jgi:hypothetical protein